MLHNFNKFLSDILKVNDPEKSEEDRFSLARVSLLLSILFYFASIVGYLFVTLQYEISDGKIFELAIEALKYPIAIFTAYSFGGKTLKSIETIINNKKET